VRITVAFDGADAVNAASSPEAGSLRGAFYLSYGPRTTRQIAATATGDDVKQALEAIGTGVVAVSKS